MRIASGDKVSLFIVGRIYIANITCFIRLPPSPVKILKSNYKGMYNVILQVHSGIHIEIQLATYAHIFFYFAFIIVY
jgi:hypothetical protein